MATLEDKKLECSDCSFKSVGHKPEFLALAGVAQVD